VKALVLLPICQTLLGRKARQRLDPRKTVGRHAFEKNVGALIDQGELDLGPSPLRQKFAQHAT